MADFIALPDRIRDGDLGGKVAIVTGGAKGIGLGCVRSLGAAGAAVAVFDIDRIGAERAAAELRGQGIKAQAHAVDVTGVEAVEAAIGAVTGAWGRVDVLVNNAGFHDGKGIEEATEADWDALIATNLKSVFAVTKAALPWLKASRGAIVNMGSMVGLVGQGRAAAYAATKGAIVALTRNLALDLAVHGIRVNCICPGWVDTPLVEAWFKLQPDEGAARAYVDSIHPLGRIATIDEIGRVALFLASPQSSFVTGIAIPVDGGVTLGY